MKRYLQAFLLIFLIASQAADGQNSPKREFRGAWIHVINQTQYAQMTPQQMKKYFSTLLDQLQSCNINAVIFQVRPAADAFYYSEIEPWSRYLTGMQGRAPEDGFDPLAFLVHETHSRNMEFHAWLNPYRVTASESDALCSDHIYFKYPERFIKYGRQIFFDPGMPENRRHICNVVRDIISRYDVDAIHLDDYFYPYPIAGERFQDDYTFRAYATRQGFSDSQLGDWRRHNVSLLIQQIHQTILRNRPWVRFGISPFGIYRNKKNTPDGSGSETNGLQNYDDLFADVLLWAQNGWIDYLVPQIYWEIGYAPADYQTLVKWWNNNLTGGQLYIGQSIERTVKKNDPANPTKNQLPRKMQLERNQPNASGNCWWPAYDIVSNSGGIADSLRHNYQRFPALIPAFSQMHDKQPKDVKSLKAQWTPNGYLLTWKRNGDPADPERAQYYVIYRFADGRKTNLDDPSCIVGTTRDTHFKLPYDKGKNKYKYVVTSVDRFHNESKKGKSKKVKL
jgi:uncharacterized lipoprotein YddW (UPF0748 family)